MGGWIKLHRKIIDWEWYKNQNVSRLFLHCLLLANYEDKTWQGNEIKRGSFVTSYDHLRACGLTLSQIRSAKAKLEKTGEIVWKSNNHFTTVTIVNYDSYQPDEQTNGKQIADQSQTDDKQIATTKNIKNIRTKELKNNTVASFLLKNDKTKEILDSDIKSFNDKFPKLSKVQIEHEIKKASDWNNEQPKNKRKIKAIVFLNNWLERCKPDPNYQIPAFKPYNLEDDSKNDEPVEYGTGKFSEKYLEQQKGVEHENRI
jgi:hypothetical protein